MVKNDVNSHLSKGKYQLVETERKWTRSFLRGMTSSFVLIAELVNANFKENFAKLPKPVIMVQMEVAEG